MTRSDILEEFKAENNVLLENTIDPSPYKMSDNDKIATLRMLLAEKYSAEHKMRERSTQFTLWLLGVGIGLVWALLTKISLEPTQKYLITPIILLIYGASINFICDISRGFKKNRSVIIKIEQALAFYKKDAYYISESIYPEQYGKNPNKKFPTSHFLSLYILLFVSAILLLILTFTNPVKTESKNIHPSQKNEVLSTTKISNMRIN